MDRDQIMQEMAQMAGELCHLHKHHEPVFGWDKHRNKKLLKVHTTDQPGLLEQLRDVGHRGLTVEVEAVTGGKPKSKPPGCFEAFSRHVYIAVEAGKWCQRVGLPVRNTVEESVLGLVGKAPNLDDGMLDKLATEVRFWHHQAASVTGWGVTPYTPPVRCPSCSAFSSVRMNAKVDGQKVVGSAYCTNPERDADNNLVCGSIWVEIDLPVLIAYVQSVTCPELIAV
jgi:hypothetical protein